MIPTYSEAAKAAIPLITRSAYKAFLFFEDENSENFYEEIVKKITPKHKSVRVVCLKGKDSLINHCKDPENNKTKDKTLYILDQDFDVFLNKKIQDESILYLDRYSIENFLYEDEAINRIVLEESPKNNKHDSTSEKVKLHLAQQSALFFELAGLFLLSQNYSLNIKSCSEAIQRFTLDKHPWLLCERKIKNYATDISELLILNGHAKNEAEIIDIFKKYRTTIQDYSNIPGKQVLDIIRFFTNHMCGVRIPSRESFSFRLASNCKFDSLSNLTMAVNKFL